MPVEFLTVGPPASPSVPDLTNVSVLGGKQGDTIVSELHGKWWTATYRGRVYIGSNAIAGSTLTTQNTTTLTFGLWNPGTGNVVIEPISYELGGIGTTLTTGTIFAKFSNQTPGTTTKITATMVSSNIGASAGPPASAVAQLLSAATITAATIFLPIVSLSSATVAVSAFRYDFDGKVALPGLALMDFGSQPAQAQALFNTLIWAEWPV
jgi:hypothetical protein